MAPQYNLNAAQLAVLQWVSEGSPANIMEGYTHRVSAAALRSRGLLKISGRGPTWQAQITPAGQAYLDSISTDDSSSTDLPAITAHPDASADHEHRPQRQPTPPRHLREDPPIALPSDLRGAHQFVIATRDATVGSRPESDGRIRIGPRAGVAHMVSSRPLLRRALLVIHGLTREAGKRGWDVVSRPGTDYGERPGIAIEIRGHRYPVEIHELTETLPFTEAEITAWRTEWTWDIESRAGKMPPPQRKRKQPAGQLRLLLPTSYGGGRASWAEGPRGSLEDKLPSILRTLEERANADDQAAIEHARRAEELRHEQEARDARARHMRIENARVDRLLAEIEAWRRSANIRAYITTLEQKLPDLDADENTRIAEWCDWANDWADRSDPTVHTSLIEGFNDEHDQSHYPQRHAR
jgi:hypothetical protein